MNRPHASRTHRSGLYVSHANSAIRGHSRGPVHPLYASHDFTTRCVRHVHPFYDDERVTPGPSWLINAKDKPFVLRTASCGEFYDDDLTFRVVRTKED